MLFLAQVRILSFSKSLSGMYEAKYEFLLSYTTLVTVSLTPPKNPPDS